jgi:hypothetical protein
MGSDNNISGGECSNKKDGFAAKGENVARAACLGKRKKITFLKP